MLSAGGWMQIGEALAEAVSTGWFSIHVVVSIMESIAENDATYDDDYKRGFICYATCLHRLHLLEHLLLDGRSLDRISEGLYMMMPMVSHSPRQGFSPSSQFCECEADSCR